MSVEDRRRKIDALVASVPPVIRPAFGPDSCILASNVGRTLLRDVGIDARMTPCRVAVFNKTMHDFIGGDLGRLTQEWPDGEDEAAHAAGARSVMVGWTDDPADYEKRFVGHCVLAVRNPDGLIDLTLDQAARPEFDIHVEPAFLPLDRAHLRRWLAVDDAAGYTEQDHGAGIVYIAAPDLQDRLLQSTDVLLPDAGTREVHRRTVDACRRAFENLLASSASRS